MRYVTTLIAIAATLFLTAWDTKEFHPKDADEKNKPKQRSKRYV